MRHFRLIALLVVIAAALSLPAVGTGASGDKVRGNACGDITLWDPSQAGPPVYTTRTPTGGTGAATVYALLTTAKPSCGGTTYTISVYDATGATLLNQQTFTGDDTTSSFSYSFSPTGAPSQVCIVATSARDGHVIDSAPDSGCYIMALDTSPGGSGLN
jgi:hypothetical protein